MKKTYFTTGINTIIFFILLVINCLPANATFYGCNLGNEIYPNPTGKRNSNNVRTYFNTSPITIRWWDGDQNCGILSTKIVAQNDGDNKCEVLGRNWGTIYAYNPADNSCRVTQVPLDDHLWLMFIIIGCFGVYFINKRVHLT